MKNLFLITVLLSFIGALNVDNVNDEQVALIAIFLLLVPISGYLFLRYWKKYSLGIYWLIFVNTFKLNRHIERNKKNIKKLKKKIAQTRQKLFDVGSVDNKILKITDENIKLWHNQVLIHERLIDLCEIRTSALDQNWSELSLLRHLIKQTKKEGNPEKKLDKLTNLVNEIDGKVSLKITNEIDRLIRELKTDTRKGKILQLEARIETLELKSGNPIERKQLRAASASI